MKNKTIAIIAWSALLLSIKASGNEQDKVLACVSMYNKTTEQLEKYSDLERYEFTYELLKSIGQEDRAKELKDKKSEYLGNSEAAKSYTDLILTLWTESCVAGK